MKFLPLIWAGIWRKPVRAVLAILQMAIAVFLFAMLQGVESGAKDLAGKTDADLLHTINPRGLLPLAYEQQIAALAGVRSVSIQTPLPATYQQPTQHVAAFGVDLKNALETIPVGIDPAQAEAAEKTRTGAIASIPLAHRYGWKIGDQISLQTTYPLNDGSQDMVFTLLGTFVPTATNPSSEMLVFNFDYFDEMRTVSKGTVEAINARVKDPSKAAEISHTIDALFVNSPYQTRTQSMRVTGQSHLRILNDLELAVGAIVGASLFALLLSLGATMINSIRERTKDIAVLKAIGLSNQTIIGIVGAEVCFTAITATAIGIGGAVWVFPQLQQLAVGLSMPLFIPVEALCIALGCGLLATAIPAIRIARLRVADGLTR